jgi:hypothetical protein
MFRSLQRTVHLQGGGRGGISSSCRRAFSTELFLPKITERRLNEAGPGGRSTNAGVKVAVFGATGFLGKHVCNQLGT